MAIDPTKLDALKALNQGGSPGYDAYQQARQSEAASRTEALRNSLGSQDIYNAAKASQAKFAPMVANTSFTNASDLAPAANQFLSQAANKLSEQNYEAQSKLALQGEAIKRQQNQLSEADKIKYLQGAADLAGEEDRSKLQESLNTQSLSDLAGKKEALRGQLTEFDKAHDIIAAGGNLSAEQVMANDQARGDILRQMADVDAQYNAAAQGYANTLGTDTKGLLEAYGTDQASKVGDLLNYLAPQRQEALDVGNRKIDVGSQQRMRELAPAFGINPLMAQGMFQEGEGNDLQRLNQQAQQQSYIAGGGTKAQQAAKDEAAAQQLGFSSGSDFASFKKSANMDENSINQTMNSSEWAKLGDMADQFVAGGPAVEQFGTGREGFRSAMQSIVNGEGDQALVNPDGTPYTTKQKANLIKLADKYFGAQIFGVQGKGASTAEEG